MWLWTCRPGFEADLAEELRRLGTPPAPAPPGPSLLLSAARPARWPVFARAGFPVLAEVPAEPEAIWRALAPALGAALSPDTPVWVLQGWVPDADGTNPLEPFAARLETETARRAAAEAPDLARRRVAADGDPVRFGGLLAQACVVSGERALVGIVPAAESPTRAPGGRARIHLPSDAPSRAGRKLLEAFDWIGWGPEAGETAADLGAAPGGWTAVLLARKVRVVAVDPGSLAPAVRQRRGVTHLRQSAFDFAPREPLDWLCCDMAWRPLEVAALLAKWGRRRWARGLVANIKLPMKRRVEFVYRVLDAVAEGRWDDLRGRQLYHDREEFTLAGFGTT